VCLWCAKL